MVYKNLEMPVKTIDGNQKITSKTPQKLFKNPFKN